MAFSELIKNFNKIRDYMRDFYIYGFKARSDFNTKSARTYDNEKRRIESWLRSYIRWENDKKGKRIYISLDSANIGVNPLYHAWKAKSFTDNDITLHFAILSALQNGTKNICDLTDYVCNMTGHTFETQTMRLKANEYVKEGLLVKAKQGKTDCYSLSSATISTLPFPRNRLLDSISFFQEVAPFGFIGSTILDGADTINELFRFKHHYIVHTLEDGILFDLLQAIREKRRVTIVQHNTRYARETSLIGIPLQVFVSVQSGRRYLCLFTEHTRRFHNFRLDHIKKVEPLDPFLDYDELRDKLCKIKPLCWGVSFGGAPRKQVLQMKLHINEETEQYVLERLKREGRGGAVTQLEQNIYLYTVALFDTTEMMAWIKSFTGRIISLDGTNRKAIDFFYRDMARMQHMYGGDL